MSLRKLLLENWPLKLTSLVLSLTIWFYVTSKGKTEVPIAVPLEFRNVPQGMAVVGDVPSSIDVRLHGQERLLRDAAALKKAVGTVDLSRCKEGENRVHISPDDIRRPPGVIVTYIAPSEISVKIEKLVRKTFRLHPVVEGKPAQGYRFAGAVVKPSRVTLEGPAGVINTFTGLRTVPVDISGIRDKTTMEARIDYQGRPVTVLDKNIVITVMIQKERT